MKSLSLTIGAVLALCLTSSGSPFMNSMERLSVENPEFVFYADLDDDFNSVGSFLTEAYLAYLSTGPELPPIPVDFNRLFANLGLSTMSSLMAVSEPNPKFGFTNQLMAAFEDSPKGAFLLGGDTNRPFEILGMAPADADLVAEMNFNGTALFNIIRNLVVDVMGPMGQGMIDQQMQQPVFPQGPTLAELINRLTTPVQIALKPASPDDRQLPPSLAILDGLAAIRVANVADLIPQFAPMLQQAGFSSIDAPDGATWTTTIPVETTPVSVFLHTLTESNDLIISLNAGAKDWFLGNGPRINTSESFNEAIEGLPTSGLSFWYSTARMAELQIRNLDSQLPESGQFGPILEVAKRFLMQYTGVTAGVSFLDGDAYRITSYQPASYKTNMGIFAVALPIGFASGYAAQLQAAQDTEENIEESNTPPSPAD